MDHFEGQRIVCGRIHSILDFSNQWARVQFTVHAIHESPRNIYIQGTWPIHVLSLKDIPCGIVIQIQNKGYTYKGSPLYHLVQTVPELVNVIRTLMNNKATAALVKPKLSYGITNLIDRYGIYSLVQSISSATLDQLIDCIAIRSYISRSNALSVIDALKACMQPEYIDFVTKCPLLSPEERYKVWVQFGKSSLEYVSKAPYVVARVACSSRDHFEKLDQFVLEKLGLEYFSKERIRRHGVQALLSSLQSIHTYAYVDEVMQKVWKSLELTPVNPQYMQIYHYLKEDVWKNAIGPFTDDSTLAELGSDCPVVMEGDKLYPKPHLDAEGYIVATLTCPTPITSLTPTLPLDDFDASQRLAVETCLDQRCAIITGSPGTGKTRTTTRVIIEFIRANYMVLACSFTGKATQRLAQLLRQCPEWDDSMNENIIFNNPCTIHKMLASPLPVVQNEMVVVVDEASMVPLQLLGNLMEKLFLLKTRWIFVGDCFQLPSIQPGRVFYDLIHCNKIPTVHLNVIHRQEGRGRVICDNAILVRQFIDEDERGVLVAPVSRVAELNTSSPEFRITDRPYKAAQAAEHARDWYHAHGNEFSRAQVLCSTNNICASINRCVRDAVNPYSSHQHRLRRIGEALEYWHRNDRVMCTQNQYHADHDADAKSLVVSNGDIGFIRSIRPYEEHDDRRNVVGEPSSYIVEVSFDDGRLIQFSSYRFNTVFEWAYAITIHKSQGSEWEHVLLIFGEFYRPFHTTAHVLYTGFTRASKTVVIDERVKVLDHIFTETKSVIHRRSDLVLKI